MVTIADVAEQAGVSKTTVSHVLSGKRPVASATRQRIEQVIAELGFRPSSLARSLRMQCTQMVALVIPDITNPYYPVLARGLQDALVDHGYHAFICNTDSDQQQEQEFLADAVQRRVDGIVLASLHRKTENLLGFVENAIPIVSLGPSIEHAEVDSVTTDDQPGSQAAIRYLLALGHRCIGMIGGSSDLNPGYFRLAGYRAALEEAGLPFDPSLVTDGYFIRQGGAEAMRSLMARSERPTAVFCANDLMAIGAMDVARELGLSVPADVALIGYDDIEAASLVVPALTTVVNPGYAMGKVAGQLLLERMQKQYTGPGRHIVVPHCFVRRASA